MSCPCLRAFFAVLSTVLLIACGDDSGVMDVGDTASPDISIQQPCETDDDCQDTVECTINSCTGGFCQTLLDPSMCQDGRFCNGMELCDPRRGCVSGNAMACDDQNVCTVDRCDEDSRSCIRTERDLDQDGDVDWNCSGGGDCDDRDPRRSSRLSEVCGDGVDNDCDMEVDESTCETPAHDRCDDPLDVSAGGLFTIQTGGLMPDFELSCAPSLPDAVLQLTLDSPRDILIRASQPSFVAIRQSCNDAASELECTPNSNVGIRRRALAAGTYSIVLASTAPSVDLEVVLADPTDPPTNTTCETATDVSAGGVFPFDLVDAGDNVLLSCGAATGSDVFYEFTLSETQNVSVEAVSERGDPVVISLQAGCGADGMPEETLRCTLGRSAVYRGYSLEPGRYFIVVDSAVETKGALRVQFGPPSAPSPGDLCDAPLELTEGTPVVSSTREAENDYETMCGRGADRVHSFTLSSTRDVALQLKDARAQMFLSLTQDCALLEGADCVNGASRVFRRGLSAGQYFVVVESSAPSDYSLTLETEAPRTPTLVADNTRCVTAHMVPPEGGLFSGDTSRELRNFSAVCGAGAGSKDAAFRIEVSERRRLIAHASGSNFAPVLHLARGQCGALVPDVCEDDPGSGAYFERVLDPGTYLLVVDGFGDNSEGIYFLDVRFEAP